MFQGKDGGSKVLQNVGILPQYYTALQPRTPQLGSVLHQNLFSCFIMFRFSFFIPKIVYETANSLLCPIQIILV
jgi:hypothetical protein